MNETVVTVEPHHATVNVRTTLNVRAYGNMSGTVIASLNAGDVVRVMVERGVWSMVDHYGQIGFVATRYLAR